MILFQGIFPCLPAANSPRTQKIPIPGNDSSDDEEEDGEEAILGVVRGGLLGSFGLLETQRDGRFQIVRKKETPLNQTASVVVELGWLPHHFFFVQIDAP